MPKRAALVTNMSVSPMMALSGVRSSWLMLETNCDLCSLAIRSCWFLSWISSNSRAFSIAIDRLVGESLHECDLLVSERLEFQSVDGDGSNQVIPFQHRDGERRPDRLLISHSIGILGIGLDVRDVYRSPLEGSACRDAVASRSDRVVVYELPELRRHVVGRHGAQKFTVEPEKERPLGLA